MNMLTLGIDLASQPSGTGLCVVEWREAGAARVVEAATDVPDERIVSTAGSCDGVALDAPFGWPDPFVRTLEEWHSPRLPALPSWTKARRAEMQFRLTDLDVARRIGRPPLSVSSDRIALPALRCASLLGALGVARRSLDGPVVEAYPAAALHAWGFRGFGYKRERGRAPLRALVDDLLQQAPTLAVTASQRGLLSEQHDAFDAFACALIARAALLGLVHPPPPEPAERIAREGWIAVPSAPLGALFAA